MTHSEPKNMIDHLITYLQHNWLIGAVGSFGAGITLAVTNVTNSTGWMSNCLFGLSALVAILSAVAKILEIRNNLKKSK